MTANPFNGNETINRVFPFSFSTATEPKGVVIDTTYFIQDSRRLGRLKQERGEDISLFTTDLVLTEIAEMEEKMSQQRNPKIPPAAFRNVHALLEEHVVEPLSLQASSALESGTILASEQELLQKLQRGLEKTLYIEELEKEKEQLVGRAAHILRLAQEYRILRAEAHRYLERTQRTTGNSDLDEACNLLKGDLVASYQRAIRRMGVRFQEIHYSIPGSFAYAPYLDRKTHQRRDLVAFLNAGLVQTLFRVVLDDDFRKDFSFYTRLEKNSVVDRSVLLAAYMLVPRTLSEGPIAVATHDNDILSLIELRQRTTLRYTDAKIGGFA